MKKIVARIVTALIIVTVLITAGWIATRENPMEHAFNELMKRPSLTAIEADYQSMYKTIHTRLVAEVGVSSWSDDPEPVHGTSCPGDLSNLDESGQMLYNPGMSPGNLPDARWDQAVAIVTEVARQHGFGQPEVVISGPSDHEILFRDKYYGNLVFGTGYNTILYGGTGCHLTQEAHDRGIYLPPKKY